MQLRYFGTAGFRSILLSGAWPKYLSRFPSFNQKNIQVDKSTIYGMIAGFVLIVTAILMEGRLLVFISLSSIVIVAGGIFCSSIITYSFKDVQAAVSLLLDTLKQNKADLRTDIEIMNMFARKARRDGLLSMENDINEIDEPFLSSGMQFLLDGIEKETMLKILADQIKSAERQLDKGTNILAKMGDYAPAYGMIGTIIGLVLMLQNIDDPKSLGMGLSVALLTTFYGTILANLVFIPLSGKLNDLGEQQLIRKQMFEQAIISLIDEENPRIMENKMLNFVSPAERAEYRAYYEKNTFTANREEKIYANWRNYQFESWQNLNLALKAG
jgi:chemotaxis protein MotA